MLCSSSYIIILIINIRSKREILDVRRKSIDSVILKVREIGFVQKKTSNLSDSIIKNESSVW